MALIILGQSKCPICNHLLLDDQSTLAFPAISNLNHPLWKYFDAGIHKDCFDSWIRKAEFLELLDQENSKS
ncbi:MAG: hypothetical protein ACO3EE_05655 [Flavobacteriales bacterium]